MAQKQAQNDTLIVRINSPDQIIWQGKAEWISSINSKGPFDILPFHANFITYIENMPIKVKTDKETIEFKFPNSVIYIRENNISIFVLEPQREKLGLLDISYQ